LELWKESIVQGLLAHLQQSSTRLLSTSGIDAACRRRRLRFELVEMRLGEFEVHVVVGRAAARSMLGLGLAAMHLVGGVGSAWR